MSISDLLADKIWKSLGRGRNRFKKLEKARQKHIILGGITLAIGLGLFFSAFAGNWAAAQSPSPSGKIAPEVVDPLNRIGQGLVKGVCAGLARNASVVADAGGDCPDQLAAEELDQKEARLKSLVARHPMAAMVPYLVKRDKRVASFLVAIAKKESDWGIHSPKKGNKECYNYWGYKGGENPTESGYSCFASPEQAVQVVGDRIEKLINNRVDTPARMVVWKCGGSCAATGGQAAADQWISAVAFYYNKLSS